MQLVPNGGANETAKTLEAFKKAWASPLPGDPLALQKADTFGQASSATSGLTYYDLEEGAKFLYPVLTPLRNSIPRVSGKGGIQANWRAVTGINTSGMRIGVSGGNRGGVMAVTTSDYIAKYAGFGLEDSVTFEAEYAGQNFDDVRGIATKTLLEAIMIAEESVILGGNADVALGTTSTPNLTDNATGGTLLHSTTYYVECVALSFDALANGAVNATGVQGAITRTNAGPYGTSDTFGGGAAAVSAEASVTTGTQNSSADTHSITASLTSAIAGAAGYAWFISTSSGAERIVAITTNPTVTITALPAGTNQLASSLGSNDNSTNSLVYDGLVYLALKSGSNAYSKAIGGTLTADAAGGIVEIDAVLKDRWDNYRLSPDTMWVNSQQALNISQKILTGSSTAAQRFTFNYSADALQGGMMVTTYINRFSMAGASIVNIKVHPNMPAGTILFTTGKLPYPLSNVGNVYQIRARQDYYQIEWPRVKRAYEYGVYFDAVLQHYFPPSMGVLYDVRAG